MSYHTLGWPDEAYEARHHWVFTNRYRCACGAEWECGPNEASGRDAFCPSCDELVDPYESAIERDKHEELDNLGFSWRRCELCGALAGDRHAVTEHTDNSDMIPLEVCEDCVMLIAYGDNP